MELKDRPVIWDERIFLNFFLIFEIISDRFKYVNLLA